ncbi:MAG TPA: PepSY-associated TM helix domain-containing protein [Bryobacteraceae bacterium]|jgi:hypothetical protein|nr:PepSY-associated TM helix domain-containing protein [Bryobacteraceae bacterium]
MTNTSVAEAKPQKAHTPHWKRKMAQWSRWLHIYLSMVSFAILFFFAATGITLNHQDQLTGEARTYRYHGTMNMAWVKPPASKDVAKLEIVEYIRKTNGIRAAVSDFRVDDNQLQVSFKGPGYEADAFIDRGTGKYEVTESRMGVIAILNDLHKGRDTGGAWSKVIDVSAVLMCLVSMSGLVLIFFLHKRRASGLLALAIGASLVVAVYWIWIP